MGTGRCPGSLADLGLPELEEVVGEALATLAQDGGGGADAPYLAWHQVTVAQIAEHRLQVLGSTSRLCILA